MQIPSTPFLPIQQRFSREFELSKQANISAANNSGGGSAFDVSSHIKFVLVRHNQIHHLQQLHRHTVRSIGKLIPSNEIEHDA
jgi:hypothetical protein